MSNDARNNRYKRVTQPNGTMYLAYRPHNKEELIKWAKKFNKSALNRLLDVSYDKRIRKIPNPPHTRTAYIKAILAHYIINTATLHQPNARNAIRKFHELYRSYHGARTRRNVENRIPNAQLVNFLTNMPSNNLPRIYNSLPFFA